MNLNFSKVDTFGPLPDDIVYGAEVILSTLGTSSTNNQKWQLRLRITEAADGSGPVMQTLPNGEKKSLGEDVDYSRAMKRQLFDDISLQEQAGFKVVEALQALGEDVKAGEDKDFEFDPPSYIGRNVGVVLVNLEYQGRITPQIKRWVNPQFAGFHVNDPALSGAEVPVA